jgi:hypothetical protein
MICYIEFHKPQGYLSSKGSAVPVLVSDAFEGALKKQPAILPTKLPGSLPLAQGPEILAESDAAIWGMLIVSLDGMR